MLGRRSNAQRQAIVKQYKSSFGKDLVKDLKSELSGDLWKGIKALLQPPAEYDASEVRAALKGLGTDDHCLIEIVCTRSPASLKEMQAAYKQSGF